MEQGKYLALRHPAVAGLTRKLARHEEKAGERFNAKTQRRGVIHLTMKYMKGMKIIHESVNERGQCLHSFADSGF